MTSALVQTGGCACCTHASSPLKVAGPLGIAPMIPAAVRPAVPQSDSTPHSQSDRQPKRSQSDGHRCSAAVAAGQAVGCIAAAGRPLDALTRKPVEQARAVSVRLQSIGQCRHTAFPWPVAITTC
jgi:hypothetical protein